ncbi:MAG: LysR family transcriptional regulator [Caulobacteraceae bacterium]|nr:LysR family transcriptional regulator [Caulobacteraceae bacterium]
MQHLDWDDFRVFIDVARARSMTRAAQALGVDHSTVSRRLSRLEYAVGAALFERGRDGVRLTEMGVTVLRRAEELATGIGNLRADLAGTAAAGGTVRLATMEGIASLWLAPRLVRLRERTPDLLVELVTSPQQVRVTRREADLFVSFFRPPGRSLRSERIGAFKVTLWAAPAYLKCHGAPGSPEELGAHLFAGYVEDLVQVDAVRWLEELVPQPRLAFTSNSMIAQMGAARGGMGIVALPSFAGAAEAGLVPVLADTLRGERELWLSVHPDLAGAPRVRALTRFLREMVVGDPAFTSPAADGAVRPTASR